MMSLEGLNKTIKQLKEQHSKDEEKKKSEPGNDRDIYAGQLKRLKAAVHKPLNPEKSPPPLPDENEPETDRNQARKPVIYMEPFPDVHSDSSSSDSYESEVEVEDEFGRTRKVPRHEAWKTRLVVKGKNGQRPIANNVIVGPYIQTEAFKLDTEKAAEVRARDEVEIEELETHYDATTEVRDKGVGYYRFEAKKKDIREEQMRQLQAVAEETNEARLQRIQKNIDDKLAMSMERMQVLRRELWPDEWPDE